MRLEREALLHRWIADGKVEFRLMQAEELGCIQVTEYRVIGTREWWSDRDDLYHFPTVKLIATLALGVAALQPPLNPTTPQWQHVWNAFKNTKAIEGFDV